MTTCLTVAEPLPQTAKRRPSDAMQRFSSTPRPRGQARGSRARLLRPGVTSRTVARVPGGPCACTFKQRSASSMMGTRSSKPPTDWNTSERQKMHWSPNRMRKPCAADSGRKSAGK